VKKGKAALSVLVLILAGGSGMQQWLLDASQSPGAPPVDPGSISGVVTGTKGPEAGVWVIAETKDLATKFIKIVVTDDRGRYLLPDLPKANYSVWVRGYGLVDSSKVAAVPGKTLNLRAVPAPNASAAAEYYPANYWYALLEPPPPSDFPGKGEGPNGNGIPEALKSQGAWLGNIKETGSCTQCHQMGNKVTREVRPALGTFKDSSAAWEARIQMGISGAFMNNRMAPIGRQRAPRVFGSWTDRIAKGEIPPVAPPRPSGVERNIVVTQWEWVSPELYAHDQISTDRRKPTVNANGPIYGVTELSGDFITVLDPVKHVDRKVAVPPHAPDLRYSWVQEVTIPSPYWGDELIWKGKIAPHSLWFDGKGRIWITARGGCRVYEPKTDKITNVPECQGTHHLQIDDNEVLWFDVGGGASSFDIKMWESGNAKQAYVAYPVVLDTNGNGKLDAGYVDAKSPLDPMKDKVMAYGQAYATTPNPVDGSVWTAYSVVPGGMSRLDPKTGLYEYFQVPYMNASAKVEGYLPHGIDADRSTGVIWMALNSGHFASFDRRKCKGPLNGPDSVTGLHCLEGWTLHQMPGPNFKGAEKPGTADNYYLNWVDWHNTSGFGENTPIANGSGSDALYALVNGKFVTMRVPYPMGFHTRSMDGRIDDPAAGWKGRAIWTTHAGQAGWHQEGGKSERPKVIKFQVRPSPIAR
jgi:hypothetical protein